MFNWKLVYEFWNKINNRQVDQDEEEKTDEQIIKERLGDYVRSDSTLTAELSIEEKAQLARNSFQKQAPQVRSRISTDSKTKVAQDAGGYEVDNVKNLLSDVVPDVIYTHFARQGFIGWEACSILKQNWIINNACNIPPQDAIRAGYDLSLTADEKIENQQIEDFKSISLKKYRILDVCARAVEKKKVFGSCLVAPMFTEDIDLSVPFNPDGIKTNTYKGMIVIEPRWLSFDFDEDSINNPLSDLFYEPTFFKLPNGKRIHRSWVIHLKNSIVPDILKPTYYYGGIPLTQMIFERVYAAEKVANEAPMLALSKRLLITDVPLFSEVMHADKVKKDIQQIVNLRDNWGIVTKKPGENFQQIDTSLSDFESVLMSQYQLVAAIAQMPATKLLKAQPTGMNATGEYDFKDYIQSLQTIQDNDMKPIIDLHNKYLSRSMGKNYDFVVTFNPIDVPTKAEMAQVNTAKTQVLTGLVSAGIISQDEARDVLRSDEDTDFLSLSDEPVENDDEENAVANLVSKMKNESNKDSSTSNL